MQNTNQFGWVSFYKEFADKLLDFMDNRSALIEKVKSIMDPNPRVHYNDP